MKRVAKRTEPTRSAVISECGTYRYSLSRELGLPLLGDGPLKRVTFLMLNPSTADAHRDDATIRTCMGFALHWGFGTLDVGNLFAYRATHPRDLLMAHRRGVDVVGPENGRTLNGLVEGAHRVVLAWGADGSIHGRGTEVRGWLASNGVGALAFGFCANGEPKHPLYQPRSAVLVPA